MDVSNTVHEKQLQIFCKAGVIEYLRLSPAERANKVGYELWVKSKLNENEILMISHGTKASRLWISLDRAVRHFRDSYNYHGRIYLDI
ncbi:hypothetical protein [Janthinobacterium sp. HH102]|uniref:hypothetical protein n=1 Tax=Janthinobacterium sp. HH102 TaxID=1537274 RepID=UPI001113156F|nr:hypothetical protein [Janthinobacterium sp. HH102]